MARKAEINWILLSTLTELDFFLPFLRYQINIQSLSQPLLISNPKKKDFHRGHKTPYKLVPELCQMTGLNDTMRQNFSLMRDMGQHLFQPPQKKADTITKFIQRLRSTTQVSYDFLSPLRLNIMFSTKILLAVASGSFN